MSDDVYTASVRIEAPPAEVFPGAAGHETIPSGSTTVEMTFTADGEATVLERVRRDLPAEGVPKHDQGWGHFLSRLVVAAAGGEPGRDEWASPTTD